MSFARVYSAQTHLLKGKIVTVEIDITKNTLHAFTLVGLPDKAVDLIDEAAAARRLESESLPKEIDKARREITRLEIEKQALSQEGQKAATAERIKEIDKQLTTLKDQNDELSSKWHSEKIKFETLHQLRQKVDNLKREAEVAEREGNLERVAQILYGEQPAAEKDFAMFEKKNFGGPATAAGAGVSVTARDGRRSPMPAEMAAALVTTTAPARPMPRWLMLPSRRRKDEKGTRARACRMLKELS